MIVIQENGDGPSMLVDKPISSIGADRLHRLEFVRGIARRLVRDNRATGIAVGLVGPWGSGKSSILNLLEAELAGDGKNPNRPMVVRFDPWLVSGRDDLIAHFFLELVKALRKRLGRYRVYDNGRDQAADAAIIAIQTYGEAISPLFRLAVPGADVLGKLVTNMVSNHEKMRSSLHTQRDDVRRELAAFDFPIVVMIDELDRVDDAEVRTMAQLIRSIADFSAISYVVAYDEDRVAEALGSGLNAADRGRAYLEKIIQLRLQVPFTRPAELKGLLGEDLRSAAKLAGLVLDEGQEQRLRRLVDIIVPGAVSTTRDIAKVISDVSARLITIEDEVDFVDCVGFVVLELRSRRISARIRESMTDSTKRIALREYFHGEVLRRFGHASIPYPLAVYPHANAPMWDDYLFDFLWPHAGAQPDAAEYTPRRIMFRRPLLILAKHAVPAEIERVSGVIEALRDLDKPDERPSWAAGELSKFEALLHRFEELPTHLTPSRIQRLLRLCADRFEELSSDPGTYLTSELILRLSGTLNRIISRSEVRTRIKLPSWIAAEIKEGRFVLQIALLAPDRALDALNQPIFKFSPSPMADKKRGELRNLLLQEMAKKAGIQWRISLPMLLNIERLETSPSTPRTYRFSVQNPDMIMEPHILSDFLALWFESQGTLLDAVRPEVVERDQLLASLRKNSQVGFGRHDEPLQRLKRARSYAGFHEGTGRPRKARRKLIV